MGEEDMRGWNWMATRGWERQHVTPCPSHCWLWEEGESLPGVGYGEEGT
jgi:hypothetical protein